MRHHRASTGSPDAEPRSPASGVLLFRVRRSAPRKGKRRRDCRTKCVKRQGLVSGSGRRVILQAEFRGARTAQFDLETGAVRETGPRLSVPFLVPGSFWNYFVFFVRFRCFRWWIDDGRMVLPPVPNNDAGERNRTRRLRGQTSPARLSAKVAGSLSWPRNHDRVLGRRQLSHAGPVLSPRVPKGEE